MYNKFKDISLESLRVKIYIYLKSLNLHLWLWLSGGELRENIYFTVLRPEFLHGSGLGIEYLR